MAEIFLYPGVKEKLRLQAEWKLQEIAASDWRAIFGKPEGFEVDALLGEMTARDLGLKRDV